MVGFRDTATVTFVPFFAPATPTSAEEPAGPGTLLPGSALPGPVRIAPDVNRPETDRTASDRVVALQVAHALAALQVPILRTLEVSVHEGHVTLRGRVRTYYERQLATVNARRTAGVKTVRGEISVAG